jgi:TM2 domain-containing membrane protein YozV
MSESNLKATKTYPICAGAQAKRCPYCGATTDSKAHPPSPVLAAALSLIIPGAGQMYKGQIAGIAWLTATLLGYLFLVMPGLIFHIVCISDAYCGDLPQRSASAKI